MKKEKFFFICIMVVILSAIIFYYNSDKIVNYFQNKEWELADSVGSVTLNSNYIKAEGTLSKLILIGTNYIKGYSNESKEEFDIFASFQDAVSDSAGDYCVVAEKNGTGIYMICGNEKIWESSIAGNIYNVYVNKNGYVAVTYKQSGYKSLVKIISPLGTELFTSYLASTYALDVAITNDNKTLAIAEVDTEGIHVVSAIKIIDINNLENANVRKYELDENSLVIDIEYTDKNDLMIMTDSKIKVIKEKEINEILSYGYPTTINISIENKKNVIAVEKEEAGLFDVNYKLCIYSYGSELEKKEYELYDLPKQITSFNNIIALAMEDELLIINTNGKLIKKCEISRNLKSMVLFDNGNTIGLIFRDKIEFIKI